MTTHLARSGAVLTLAMGLWLGLGSLAHADNLDEKLVARAPEIVAALETQGYKNVGIIRARVQLGNKKPSFAVGPLNGNLPTRLENALVMYIGSEPKLGIIHNASQAAADAKVGDWFMVPAERKKLFEVSYPLAWGDKKDIKASALLAPLVKVSADFTRVTVVLEAFTSDKPGTMVPIAEVTADTDTQMLHDLGRSYNVAVRGLKDRSGGNIRKLAIKVARDGEDNPPMPPATPPATPPAPAATSVPVGDLLEFKLLSGGAPVEIKGTEIVCPDPAKPIVFSLTNKAGKGRIGVDVKLNGKSLFEEQTEPAEQCQVWVIDEGKTAILEGFYTVTEKNEKNLSRFKILVGDEVKEAQASLGEKAGLIEITVFTEATEPPPAAEELQISSRNLRALPTQEDQTARKDLRTLQDTLLKRNMLKRDSLKRNLIVKDTAEEAKVIAGLKLVKFKKASQAPAAVVLKLLPKAAPTTDSGSPQP